MNVPTRIEKFQLDKAALHKFKIVKAALRGLFSSRFMLRKKIINFYVLEYRKHPEKIRVIKIIDSFKKYS